MLALIRFYWGMCTFSVRPERTPTYPAFLITIAAAFFIFNVAIRMLVLDTAFGQAFVGTAIATSIFVGVVWGLLWFKRLTGRLNATLGALLGQDLFMGILALPLQMSMASDQPWSMSFILILMVYCWDLAVKGFILRKALNVDPLLGMCTALMLLLLAVYAEVAWKIHNPESKSEDTTMTIQKSSEPIEVHNRGENL